MVDVIIPSYNRRELLKRAVRSVQKQTFRGWRLWAVDDGSTDGTAEEFARAFGPGGLEGRLSRPRPALRTASQAAAAALAADFEASRPEPSDLASAGRAAADRADGLAGALSRKTRPFKKKAGGRIELVRLKSRKGVSYARNRGIERGREKWVAFLDSDDEWLPEKLEKQLEFAAAHPDLPLIHCNEIWLKNGRPLAQKKKHKKQGGRIFIPAARLCCVSPSAALLKRSLLEEIGLFREDFPVCEDYELWLRALSRYAAGFVEEALVIKHGGHGDQLSRRYPAMDFWRVKALKDYVEDSRLSEEERLAAGRILREKAEILLKGCKKHGNFAVEKEIRGILRGLKPGLSGAAPPKGGRLRGGARKISKSPLDFPAGGF